MFIYFLLGSTAGQLISPEQATTHGCLTEGTRVIYECAVKDNIGHGSTVWQGSAFTCSSGQVLLDHSDYSQPGGVNGTCGDLFAESVAVNGSEYTSRLTVMITWELDGETINCILDRNNDIKFSTIEVCSVPCIPKELTNKISTSVPGITKVDNGYLLFHNHSTAVLHCNDGCNPESPSFITCMSNGSWSSSGQDCMCPAGWMIPLGTAGGSVTLIIAILGLIAAICKCISDHL